MGKPGKALSRQPLHQQVQHLIGSLLPWHHLADHARQCGRIDAIEGRIGGVPTSGSLRGLHPDGISLFEGGSGFNQNRFAVEIRNTAWAALASCSAGIFST